MSLFCWRGERRGLLENLCFAVRHTCRRPETILVTVDMDDCLLGNDALGLIRDAHLKVGGEARNGGGGVRLPDAWQCFRPRLHTRRLPHPARGPFPTHCPIADAVAQLLRFPHGLPCLQDGHDLVWGGHLNTRKREVEPGGNVAAVVVDKTRQRVLRGAGNVWQHLRSFRKSLFDRIRDEDLRTKVCQYLHFDFFWSCWGVEPVANHCHVKYKSHMTI